MSQHEESLQSIVDALDKFIFDIDLDGVVKMVTEKVFDFIGFHPPEVVGKTVFEFMPPVEAERAQVIYRGFIAARTPVDLVDFTFVSKDGEEKFLSVSARPVFSDDGVLIGYLGIGSDITEKRMLEDRLRHSEKLDSIGRLAGGIAHDFNNQLASIVGFAEIIATSAPEPFASYAKNIILSGKNSADLVKQLLSFARKGKMKNIPFDLHCAIQHVATMSSRSFDKRIRFVLDLCQGAIIMRGDPSNIENALLNLACNARDAMPEGGDIVFRTRMISNETVRIEVEDSGVGMPQSVLRHLFEPFFSTKGEFGNGLGMAAVYGAIKTHNGNIEVESVEGKGTKVIIDLPIVTVPSVDETEIGVVRAPYAANVLVVDDEESVRDMLKSVLGMLGYSAVFASTAAEAVKRYEDNCLNVDFVLLDVVLPDGTGTTVFNELVKINPKVKAVVMSGYTGSHLDESLVQRAFALVNKPFAVGELSQAMARCLVS